MTIVTKHMFLILVDLFRLCNDLKNRKKYLIYIYLKFINTVSLSLAIWKTRLWKEIRYRIKSHPARSK